MAKRFIERSLSSAGARRPRNRSETLGVSIELLVH